MLFVHNRVVRCLVWLSVVLTETPPPPRTFGKAVVGGGHFFLVDEKGVFPPHTHTPDRDPKNYAPLRILQVYDYVRSEMYAAETRHCKCSERCCCCFCCCCHGACIELSSCWKLPGTWQMTLSYNRYFALTSSLLFGISVFRSILEDSPSPIWLNRGFPVRWNRRCLRNATFTRSTGWEGCSIIKLYARSARISQRLFTTARQSSWSQWENQTLQLRTNPEMANSSRVKQFTKVSIW